MEVHSPPFLREWRLKSAIQVEDLILHRLLLVLAMYLSATQQNREQGHLQSSGGHLRAATPVS
jgi:hypothetical protein